jgi:hypothetical protein
MEGLPAQNLINPAGYVNSTTPSFVPNPQRYATWYKSTSQTMVTGSPGFTTITFNTATPSSDTSSISLTGGGSTFTVNRAGTYLITIQITYANLMTVFFTQDAMGIALSLTRAGATASVLRESYRSLQAIDAPSRSLTGYFELQLGDVFSVVSNGYFSLAGSGLIVGVSSFPNNFDLNTSISWSLLNPA